MTKLICTILGRGGSKGVRGKNLRPLCGKPLIAWSVEQAKATGLFSIVAVSSDDTAILEVGQRAGADLLVERPGEMATDSASKLPAIYHCVLAIEAALGCQADIVVDLQPTSPLRLPADITAATALLTGTGAESVITGQGAKCSPYFSLVEQATDGTVHLSKQMDKTVVRRQEAPACFDMNGSIYAWPRTVMTSTLSVFYPSTRLLEMPEDRSIDIDTELDFMIAETLMRRRLGDEQH